MATETNIRTYQRDSSVVFLKTNEKFGGLSNMAGGYPLLVNGVRILTSEALYQACRFPHLPDVQKMIIGERSPMTAKMKSKPYRQDSRPDWDRVRVKIMRWSLRVKLAQNWRALSDLLLETGDRSIVEESRKDDFWGAYPTDGNALVGKNVLGRLLMELREEIKTKDQSWLLRVEPLDIGNFLLNSNPITVVTGSDAGLSGRVAHASAYSSADEVTSKEFPQQSLFDAPSVRDGSLPTYSVQMVAGVRIADLKPYSEYKGSGSPWLGSMPAHWKLVRLGSALCERRETNEDNQVTQVLSVLKSVGVIRYEDKGRIGNKRSEDIRRYKIVRPDDIVVNCMNVIIGSVGRSRYTGCLSPVYYVLTKRSVEDSASYFAAIFSATIFHESLVRIGNGILAHRMRIPMELLKCEMLPVPPPDEQAAIVRFLDWANGRLERTIRAKRKVIALLNEQKQAIIHRAVTRGLDPNVPLKPSRIPWLGDIPEHWSVVRIKYLLREVDVRSVTGNETLLSMRMHHGLVIFADHFSRPPQAATLVGFKVVRPGQFVVNRMQAGNGVIFASTLHGLVSPDYAVFSPIGDANVDFLGELFRSRNSRVKFRAESKGLGTGTSGFLRLYNDRLGAIHVALPPVSEQQSILDGLATELAGVNDTISRFDREVELLREYRTRLVADVVTGKLDVREAAARLPEEAAPEIVDDESNEADEVESADEEAAA